MEKAMTHQVLRTPDSAFTNLKDYPFAPNYLEVDGMRVHYVDEGDREARVIFLLHCLLYTSDAADE